MILPLRKKPTKRSGFGRFDTSDEDRLFFGMKATSDGGDL
jgi:predicted small integral membrane protein